MVSTLLAALIATVLFFCFERTRAFGIIGVFALIAVNPTLFIPTFIVLAGIYGYALYLWRK